ncbi:translation initiation factor IF-3 [Patescibacteria group bacterium]|nr:translation initiation factor IF-3 [Patescibacteria group bacterium]
MIKAPRIIIVDAEGQILGTYARDEALRMAGEQGLDLVQIAYNPVDMVCTAKMVDYGKYMYNKQKDDKEKKKTQKSKGMKEVKFGYTIGDNDLQLKMKKSIEFLEDGYSVRFAVRLKGRERIYADKVAERLHYIEEALKEFGRSQ